MDFKKQLEEIKNQKERIKNLSSLEELKELEIKLLGRKQGEITKILRQLKELSLAERKKIGQLANQDRKSVV